MAASERRQHLDYDLIVDLVASFTSDWLYPSSQSREIVSALMQVGREVSYVELESVYGHDAFLLESARLCQIVRSFLDNVASPPAGPTG